MTSAFLDELPFVWAAHRGASADCPENTMAAFLEAVRQRADLVELDVRLSRDGEVVVLHDDSLDRTTGGSGKVWERSGSELAALDAGSWFDPRFGGEGVPRLRDVLERVAPLVPVNVELKGRAGLGLAAKVVELARDLGVADRVLVSAFRFGHLEEIAAIDPSLPLGLLYEETPVDLEDATRRTGARFLHPAAGLVNDELLRRARGLGLRTVAWTVDDPTAARVLIDDGVDGIITNRVGDMVQRFAR
jgi:glycerophosphoryl diester phosphodiesterase